MKNIEKLTEALEFAEIEGIEWWLAFDTLSTAEKIIKLAIKEVPDEESIICFLDIYNYEYDMIDDKSILLAYRNILNRMKKELKNDSN